MNLALLRASAPPLLVLAIAAVGAFAGLAPAVLFSAALALIACLWLLMTLIAALLHPADAEALLEDQPAADALARELTALRDLELDASSGLLTDAERSRIVPERRAVAKHALRKERLAKQQLAQQAEEWLGKDPS